MKYCKTEQRALENVKVAFTIFRIQEGHLKHTD